MNDNTAELIRKLNIKPAANFITLYAPHNYLNDLPDLIVCQRIDEVSKDSRSIQAFYTDEDVLENEMPKLKNALSRDGQLWISWPKKSSGVNTDLSDNVVRHIGLTSGLVDVKVVSVNETWSGLKFVYRLSDR